MFLIHILGHMILLQKFSEIYISEFLFPSKIILYYIKQKPAIFKNHQKQNKVFYKQVKYDKNINTIRKRINILRKYKKIINIIGQKIQHHHAKHALLYVYTRRTRASRFLARQDDLSDMQTNGQTNGRYFYIQL